MSGKPKTETVPVRMDRDLKRQLEKEAIAKGLDLGTYLRMLIVTHQDRGKD